MSRHALIATGPDIGLMMVQGFANAGTKAFVCDINQRIPGVMTGVGDGSMRDGTFASASITFLMMRHGSNRDAQ